ncbi:hypothetical protein JFK97_02025 [Chromobacterium phragmitis]|uniref:hypothetical protein n=1 Tax=Chromobacterium amazonense TaxID=1382803 RepID=UPI0021B7F054|nr:hypothetical protein [Chromobacterium amazonense]MBM2883157.1 hypothetical protein [Chromobacterium amazonense]MDE1715690.1 hypothetical protein [Chromobacterium amazonense]
MNRGGEVQDAFDAALSRMASGCARPHMVLLISAPREVCMAALFALSTVGRSPQATRPGQ